MRRDFITTESRCKYCNEPITWFYTSKKTGKKYPTNILVDSSAHALVTSKLWFHKCERRQEPDGYIFGHPVYLPKVNGKTIPIKGKV